MGFEVDTSELEVAVVEFGRDRAMEAARRANSASQEILLSEGDERDYEVFPIVQSAQPAEWDSSREAAVFDYTHRAAQFLHDGTQTHPVVADGQTLAFEWPEMEGEEYGDTGKTFDEVFADSWPTVFFPAVEVDGLPALRYVDRGLAQAGQWLEDR